MMIKHSYLLLTPLLLTSCSQINSDEQTDTVFLHGKTPLEISTTESSTESLEDDELSLYKKEHLALSSLITLFINSGSSPTFPQKEELLKLYDKVSSSYYKLALQIYQQTLENYLKFNVSGNLTIPANADEPWDGLIKTATSISFFERRGVHQRLDLILGSNPSKEFTAIETLYAAHESSERQLSKAAYAELEKKYAEILKGGTKAQNLFELKSNLQKAITIKTWAAFSDSPYPLDWEDEDLEPLPTKLSANGAAIANKLRTNLISKQFAINHTDLNEFTFEERTNLD
ncbi:MAG: hypothetical protein H6492_01245, partial [Candidatus Paracaedibacteraceae bacterium]|nr:hypothetical protein [Candidatus Paracaedibacteraceae bacterium]